MVNLEQAREQAHHLTRRDMAAGAPGNNTVTARLLLEMVEEIEMLRDALAGERRLRDELAASLAKATGRRLVTD